jgi:hypothetical protein
VLRGTATPTHWQQSPRSTRRCRCDGARSGGGRDSRTGPCDPDHKPRSRVAAAPRILAGSASRQSCACRGFHQRCSRCRPGESAGSSADHPSRIRTLQPRKSAERHILSGLVRRRRNRKLSITVWAKRTWMAGSSPMAVVRHPSDDTCVKEPDRSQLRSRPRLPGRQP